MCIFYQFSLILVTESMKWIVMLCVYICQGVSFMKLLNTGISFIADRSTAAGLCRKHALAVPFHNSLCQQDSN